MKTSKLQKIFKSFQEHFESFKQSSKKKELKKSYIELQESYNFLYKYNSLLEQRVEEEVQKRQVHEKILAKQTRLAAMGEMLEAVAHQWSQPLSIIDMRVNLMPEDFQNGLINKDYIKETVDSINRQKEHLVSTLKKFRCFLNPIDKSEHFNIDTMIKDTLVLIKDEMLKNNISIMYESKKTNIIYGSSGEIKHVLINLLNNAKDAFNRKQIKNRSIIISLKERPLYYSINVEDNAGGIDESIIKNIFKPYVTTKKSSDSSGVGLYMSRLIMQKYNGKIRAKNINDGAKFLLKFYKEV